MLKAEDLGFSDSESKEASSALLSGVQEALHQSTQKIQFSEHCSFL